MAEKPPKPDWKHRWFKRRLDVEELVDVVLDFVGEAVLAEEALRAFLTDHGLPVDRTLAGADQGRVPQTGDLPDGGNYWFHGIGCVIKVRKHAPVDVDWMPDGTMILDASKILHWLVLHGASMSDTSQDDAQSMAAAMQLLVDAGVLAPTDWWAHFTLVVRPSDA